LKEYNIFHKDFNDEITKIINTTGIENFDVDILKIKNKSKLGDSVEGAEKEFKALLNEVGRNLSNRQTEVILY